MFGMSCDIIHESYQYKTTYFLLLLAKNVKDNAAMHDFTDTKSKCQFNKQKSF